MAVRPPPKTGRVTRASAKRKGSAKKATKGAKHAGKAAGKSRTGTAAKGRKLARAEQSPTLTADTLLRAFLGHPVIAEAMRQLALTARSPRAAAAAVRPQSSRMSASVALEALPTRLSGVEPSGLGALEPLPVTVATSMDTRLQLAVANHRTGKRAFTLASTTSDELPVIARVSSVDAWEAIPDVVPGSRLGSVGDSLIVTGRIPIERVEAVRGEAAVLSLKASQPVHPALSSTVPAMMARPGDLPEGAAANGGKGVVIGVVDFGCDFAHRNFVNGAGGTRLLALWNQAGVAMPDSPFGYGRVYAPPEIDAALGAADPYAALGYGPPPDGPFQQGTHGTHVMDIAAGNGSGSGQPGVAPQADLVFVEVSSNDVPWSGPESVNKTFGDSVQLLEAVRFVFDTAADRPCVCNISLGTNGGPHDGTSLVEQGLDAIVREKPNRAVVIAASNSQLDGIHTAGQVPGSGDHDIVWRQRNQGGGEFELWYPGKRRLEITVIGGDGTSFGPVAPGDNLSMGSAGHIAIFISSRLDDPNNHDNVIGVWIATGLPGDNWTVRLRSGDGSPVDYHAWIERNDQTQASFAAPVATHTLGSISTGRESIVVGSYDAHKPGNSLSNFSSSGPTRDGRNKPELSAPGHNVMAARSRTGTGVVRKSGTSMAAPAAAGLVALLLADARHSDEDVPIDALRDRLLSGVLRNPPDGAATSWDPRYGFGRASSASLRRPQS